MSIITVVALVLLSFFVVVPTQMPTVKGYVTPGLGLLWNFDDLVANSGGDVMGGGGIYVITNDLTISGGPTPDTVYTRDGEIILVLPGFTIFVDGIFLSQPVAGPVLIQSGSMSPQPSDWGGFQFTPGSIGRFLNTELWHARQGLRITDGDVTIRNSVVRDCYPDAIYFESGLLHINSSAILGVEPPSSAGTNNGGGAIYATGNIADVLWINNSMVIGGNGLGGGGGGGGVGGWAIFTVNTVGPIGLIGNSWIQGGSGGYNNIDAFSAGGGSLAFHAFPVWDPGGPMPSINISGNQFIRGGNGGLNNASFDGSSGWGGQGIIISDDNYAGNVVIANNQYISGGNGGDNTANWNVGFTVGSGGPGITLDNVGSSPGFPTRIVGNALISGGKGGNNSGAAMMGGAFAGWGGTALNINDGRNIIIRSNLIAGGHGGNNTMPAMGVTAGQGGTGVYTTISTNVLIDRSDIDGGEGGDDYVGQGPGMISGPGQGGNGINSLDSTGTVVNSTVTGGEGGDNYGTMGQGRGGGVGVYQAGTRSLQYDQSTYIGGKGGDNYNDTGLSGGQGSYGILIIDSQRLTVSNSDIYGGAGGDCFAGMNAIPGNGGSGLAITDAARFVDILDNTLITIGQGGVHWLIASQGLKGDFGVQIGMAAQTVSVHGNYVYNASFAGIYNQAPGVLIDGNTVESDILGMGIYLDPSANWTNITNNPRIGDSFLGINVLQADNVTILNNLVDNTDIGIAILGSKDVHVDRTRINDASTWAVRLQTYADRVLVENCSITNSPTFHFSANMWSNATTLNTTFDGTLVDLLPDTRLTVKNYLDVLVLDQTLAPIQNSEVEILDNAAQVYATPGFGGVDPTTDPNGEVNWIVVTDRIYYGNPMAMENLTDAQVAEGGRIFVNNPRAVDMYSSHQEVFYELGADPEPPQVLNVLLDGVKFRTVLAGASVNLNATLDDTVTGNSNITVANYTIGAANWPGAFMTPWDGSYDSPVEDVYEFIDTTAWMPGSYEIWVYGCDDSNNCNYTGDFATLNITAVIDNVPPEINNVAVNGLPMINVVAGTLVEVTAELDDSPTGGSNILFGNYTIGQSSWPGVPLLPLDGAYDSMTENVNETIDTTGWLIGIYEVWVYACDIIPNCNTTGDLAIINIVAETIPPEIYSVTANGMAWVDVPAGTVVTLNATVDDTLTGGSMIIGANYTMGILNWPGTGMNAVDGMWNDMVEDVTAQVDTTGWNCGPHELYVYGWDEIPNYNTTSTAFATINITVCDQQPPRVLQVRIDGQPSQTYFLSALPVNFFLSAVINDEITGMTTIGGANYTSPAANWPGIPLNPLDGSFDTPWEDVGLTVSMPSLPGTYIYCVYGWDIVPNYNTTGGCASLDIVDDLEPEVLNVLLNGQPLVTVFAGTPVTVTADIDDSVAGGSNIWDARWAEQGTPWPGTLMNPSDGAFDSPTEAADAVIDTTGWTPGDHIICVYGRDVMDNRNTACTFSATLRISAPVDAQPPEVTNVLVDGAGTRTVTAGMTVTLTATVDDEATGMSDIGGANFTIGLFNWPGTDMNPQDGAFDNVVEAVTYGVDTTGWTLGSYDICVYGWDIVPNYNTTSTECATIIIVGDLTPPTASGSPTGVGVSVTTNITLQFSEPMNTATVEASFGYTDLVGSWGAADGTFTWSNGDQTAVFNPTNDLGYSTTYLVRLVGGIAEDLAGNSLDGNGDGAGGDNYTFAFKTEDDPGVVDTTPPSVEDTNPADGATDVSVDIPIIEVEFDEPMSESVIIVSLDGISVKKSWDGNTLIITPRENLDYDTTYTVTISNIEDLAGNSISDYEFEFTTETAPEPHEEPEEADLTLWWLLVIILVIIIVILMLLLMRRRKPEEEMIPPMVEEEPPVEEMPYVEEEMPEPPIDELHFEEEGAPETGEILEDEEG